MHLKGGHADLSAVFRNQIILQEQQLSSLLLVCIFTLNENAGTREHSWNHFIAKSWGTDYMEKS